MTDHQSRLNEWVNDTVADFMAFYPDATLENVLDGLRDAISDAPQLYAKRHGAEGETGEA